MAAKMKPNRRVGRQRNRKGLFWLPLLATLTLCSVFVAKRLSAGSHATVEPPIEEPPEAAAPAPPPGPRALPATVVARSALEGWELEEGKLQEDLAADSFFILESEHAIPDLRFRLFDESHRLVPAEESLEVGQGTRYRLVPKEALQAGSRYTLVAEGQESGQPSDVSDQSYLPARYSLQIRGE